jgi:chaperonin GroES
MKPAVMPGKLLVEEFPEQTVTSSGLFVTSDPHQSNYEGHGTVIAVGPPRKFSDGTEEVSELQPGDEIYYSNTTSSQARIEGKVYLIIKEEAVLVRMSKD